MNPRDLDLLRQADQYNTRLQPKSSGNFLTSILPTAGGILGGIGGSIVAPGLGTAAGGAAGAGFGKFLQNLFENREDKAEGILGEAAFGTLGGIGKGIGAIKGAAGALKAGEGAGRAGDILRMGTQAAESQVPKTLATGGAGKKLESLGAKMLASQGQLTAQQARSKGINPTEVFGNLNKRTGLTNLDDMAEVSKMMTGGKDSFLDMLTREAVGGTSGVNAPDLRKTAATLLDDVGSVIPDGQRKQLLQNATRAGASMRGGSEGTLSSLADPQRALDAANSFRTTARDLSTGFNTTPEQKQLANVYNSLGKAIEDSIYSSPGVGKSVPSLARAGADDLLFKAEELAKSGKKGQAKALEKVANELRGATDVKGLRSMKKDFVDLGNIDRATAQAQGARSISGADTANSLRNPFNILGMAMDTATPAVGGGLASAGRALQSGLGGGGNPPAAARIAGTQLGGRALLGGLPGQSEQVAPTEQGASQQAALMSGLGTGGDAAASLLGGGGAQSAQSLYSQQAVAQDILKDFQATGGENLDKYITLYQFLNPEPRGGDLNATTQKALSQSANADSTLGQLESMLQTAGGGGGILGGNVNSFLGSLGLNNNVKAYNDLASGSVTQIARALGETGAMSDTDRTAYMNLIPKITDTPEVAKIKFEALRERMANAQQNTLQYGAGSPDASSILAMLGA